ncbi:MAG: 16S rRNA (uracil(1498)-N(3))-methyltransferase [Gemmatimonadota bacterium]|nr:16S rRNA (uracil(1498)-N(3))-methyltransferase [Gemmatimonadota bacterium]
MTKDRSGLADAEGGVATLFAPDMEALEEGDAVPLDGDELMHVRSLRLRPGDGVQLTDGRGGRWAGRVAALERRSASITLGTAMRSAPDYALDLWAPVGHKDRSLWLVEKAVEIGVRTICFVEFAGSRSVADAGRSDAFSERARRRAIAALKQCGGSRLPVISIGRGLAECLEALDEDRVRWLVDLRGSPVAGVARETGRGPLTVAYWGRRVA